MRFNLKREMQGVYLDSKDGRIASVLEREIVNRLEEGMAGLLNSTNHDAFQFTIPPTPDISRTFSPGMVISIAKAVDFEGVEDYIFMISDRTRTFEGKEIPDTILAVLSYQNHTVTRRGKNFIVVTWHMQDADDFAVELKRASVSREDVPCILASGMNTFLQRRTGERNYFTH